MGEGPDNHVINRTEERKSSFLEFLPTRTAITKLTIQDILDECTKPLL